MVAVLWMALVVGIPIYLVYRLTARLQTDEATDSALAVLREQYAHGEIDDEEFDRQRSVLATTEDGQH